MSKAQDKSSHAQKSKKPASKRPDAPKSPAAAAKEEKKRRLSKGAKIVLVAIGCLAMVLSVTSMACSGVLNQVAGQRDYNLTGGVAATVGDAKITEDTVTEAIMQTKSQYEDDAAWAQYLVDNGLTPESLREQTIETYVQQALEVQAMDEYGITVSAEELEQAWQDAAASYGGEDSLLSVVQMMGYDKDSYKQSVLASQLEQEKLQQTVAPVDVTDDDVLSYINENIDTYNDARRSSHILFSVEDDGSNDAEQKEKAQSVLDQINSGEITFEDAAKEYSDDGSGADGGDVGWDKLTQFVTEYQDALSGLDKGQVSGLVRSTYGYHIIMCTDVFHVDGSVGSLDQVPQEISDYVRNILETQEEQTAYSAWFEEYRANTSVTVNPMPEGLPYDVSLEGVEPSATTDESASADASSSTDEAAAE